MDNIQLYKTSTLLTGQLKWDIVIGTNEDILEVQDFHITPISEFVPYNRKSENDLLKRPHQANIKQYFKDTYGSFYSNYTKPQLNSDWPYMESNDETLLYDDTYLSGAKRIEYSLYNKQFGYLIPVWLEKLEPNQTLNFDIYILGETKSEDKDIVLGVRTLTFELNQLADKFHNRFVQYFRDYLHYVGIDSGNDNVINIGFDKSQAYISGIELESGNYITKDISKIVPILLSRERPLLEFDSIITNCFKNNEMICSNLINFNICFDIDDILSQSATQFLYGRKVRTKIDVSIGRAGGSKKLLPKKDLYTNFEELKAQETGLEYILNGYVNGIPQIVSNKAHKNNYIDRETAFIQEDIIDKLRDIHGYWQSGEDSSSAYNTGYKVVPNENWDIYNKLPGSEDDIKYKDAPNVFDYLDDYKCVDLMNKNKVVQNIMHWSLYDNPDYIFNIYEGFAGYYGNKRVEHRYGATPDIQKFKYEESLNNNAWANVMRVDNIEDYYTFVSNHYTIFDNYSTVIGNTWVNGLKYAPKSTDNIKPGRLLLVLFTGNATVAREKFKEVVKKSGKNSIPVVDDSTGRGILITFAGVLHSDIIICAWNRDDLVLPNILNICGNKLVQLDEEVKRLRLKIGKFEQTGECRTIQDEVLPFDAYNTSYTVDSNVWDILPTVETKFGRMVQTYNSYSDHTLFIKKDYINAERLYGYFYTLYSFLNSVIPLPLVVLNNSLYKIKAHSPSLTSTEIEYYKHDNCGPIYFLRYDGKIKPCMTGTDKYRFNYIYEKKWDEQTKWNTAKYSKSKYSPLFPSIGYWSYNKKHINYTEPPLSIAEQKWLIKNGSIKREEREIKWYHENTLFCMPETIEFNIISKTNHIDDINELITAYISKLFDGSKVMVQNIKLYNIYFDLVSWSDAGYNYSIKMTIK